MKSISDHLVILFILVLVGCGGQPVQTVKGPQPSPDAAVEILGPITKEKILDRLVGYPICGIKDEAQKELLILRFHELNTAKPKDLYLVEVECFFLGVQGLFEFGILQRSTGVFTPLTFEGAVPAVSKIGAGLDRRSPASINQGRHELCGSPDFDKAKMTLTNLCKARSEGGCGIYGAYTLQLGSLNVQGNIQGEGMPHFKLNEARYLSCESPSERPAKEWPTL